MKQLFIGVALAAAMSSCAVAASTDPYESGFYLATGNESWVPAYKNDLSSYAPKYLYGGDIQGGWRFNRYYSIEAGYAIATNSATVRATVQAVSIDAYGYLPLGRASHFALFATAGASELWGTASVTGYGYSVSATSNAFGGRVGGGLQYQINRHFGFRISSRYEFANFAGVKGAGVGAVSFVWHPG
jgi:opacity protein-like surface antigen